jgi:hypothetical protein
MATPTPTNRPGMVQSYTPDNSQTRRRRPSNRAAKAAARADAPAVHRGPVPTLGAQSNNRSDQGLQYMDKSQELAAEQAQRIEARAIIAKRRKAEAAAKAEHKADCKAGRASRSRGSKPAPSRKRRTAQDDLSWATRGGAASGARIASKPAASRKPAPSRKPRRNRSQPSDARLKHEKQRAAWSKTISSVLGVAVLMQVIARAYSVWKSKPKAPTPMPLLSAMLRNAAERCERLGMGHWLMDQLHCRPGYKARASASPSGSSKPASVITGHGPYVAIRGKVGIAHRKAWTSLLDTLNLSDNSHLLDGKLPLELERHIAYVREGQQYEAETQWEQFNLSLEADAEDLVMAAMGLSPTETTGQLLFGPESDIETGWVQPEFGWEERAVQQDELQEYGDEGQREGVRCMAMNLGGPSAAPAIRKTGRYEGTQGLWSGPMAGLGEREQPALGHKLERAALLESAPAHVAATLAHGRRAALAHAADRHAGLPPKNSYAIRFDKFGRWLPEDVTVPVC